MDKFCVQGEVVQNHETIEYELNGCPHTRGPPPRSLHNLSQYVLIKTKTNLQILYCVFTFCCLNRREFLVDIRNAVSVDVTYANVFMLSMHNKICVTKRLFCALLDTSFKNNTWHRVTDFMILRLSRSIESYYCQRIKCFKLSLIVNNVCVDYRV